MVDSKWLWLSAIVLLLSSIFLWLIEGRVLVTVRGEGMIISASIISKTDRMIQDNIQQHADSLNKSKSIIADKRALFRHQLLTITDMHNAEMDLERANEEFKKSLNAENLSIPVNNANDGENLTMLGVVYNADAKKVKIGRKVRIYSDDKGIGISGYVEGEVVFISDYPVTKPYLNAFLTNIDYVNHLFTYGVPYMIKIKIDNSSKKTKRYFVRQGAVVKAEIITEVINPIQLIIT